MSRLLLAAAVFSLQRCAAFERRNRTALHATSGKDGSGDGNASGGGGGSSSRRGGQPSSRIKSSSKKE